MWACSSDDDGETTNDVTAGGGAGNVSMMTDASSSGSMSEGAPPMDHSVTTMSDTGSVSDAKAHVNDAGKIVDAGQVDASKACVSYCSCMAVVCVDKVFPMGCLWECATQTNWDLPCRTNMCGLVDAQPLNDHCTHAFGVGQCTDN